VVRLFYAPRLVGKGSAADLRAPLGGPSAPLVHVDPLDAQWPVGAPQQCRVDPLWGRRAGLALAVTLVRLTMGHRLAYLEVDAILDHHPPSRAHGDSTRALRGGGYRRRDLTAALQPRHVPAARQSLPRLHAALDDLHARRLQFGLFRVGRRARL